MALNATVYKVKLDIADVDRGYYAQHALTVARHPSETTERMMMRILAFARYASDRLSFGRGLSTDDEPALWDKDLTDAILLWVDVGLPDERVVRRACGRARNVVVLAYGGRATDAWWQTNQTALAKNDNLTVLAVDHAVSKALAKMAERQERTLDLQCTIQDDELWLDDGNARIAITLARLQEANR